MKWGTILGKCDGWKIIDEVTHANTTPSLVTELWMVLTGWVSLISCVATVASPWQVFKKGVGGWKRFVRAIKGLRRGIDRYTLRFHAGVNFCKWWERLTVGLTVCARARQYFLQSAPVVIADNVVERSEHIRVWNHRKRSGEFVFTGCYCESSFISRSRQMDVARMQIHTFFERTVLPARHRFVYERLLALKERVGGGWRRKLRECEGVGSNDQIGTVGAGGHLFPEKESPFPVLLCLLSTAEYVPHVTVVLYSIQLQYTISFPNRRKPTISYLTTIAQNDGHQPQCKHYIGVRDSAAPVQISHWGLIHEWAGVYTVMKPKVFWKV
uniref:Uncharacterized protein n=1 Tax=Timema bartmani TaxID=61472 RepID=A0A7R9HXM8_9NEOP|nr:unnamed protein product [Timema bartmani]